MYKIILIMIKQAIIYKQNKNTYSLVTYRYLLNSTNHSLVDP